MYEVIYKFADMEDGLHVYEVGDKFPREGVKVSGRRIAELASTKNKIGQVLIKKIQVEEEPEVEEGFDVEEASEIEEPKKQ